MKEPSNRIPAEGKHRLAGTEVDRSKPIRFRLNGQNIPALVGDTVLSAVLAAGIAAAGTHADGALALDGRFAPLMAPRKSKGSRPLALAMDRTPALEGLDLITLGERAPDPLPRRLARRLTPWRPNTRRSLDHRFGADGGLAGSWVDLAPTETVTADLLVVGGGIAGLSAAVAAGQKGDRVLLVERRPVLGGDVRFFGSVDGEDAPDAIVKGLRERLALLPNVTVWTHTEAFALFDGAVRAHRTDVAEGTVQATIVSLVARRIVIATGTLERLPVFPGNRLPGVTGALSAFHLADRHGVWPGARAVIATSASEPYRLAMLAQDAGITVQRVVDTRLGPQSRFIEFSKAYGVALAHGLMPAAAAFASARAVALEITLAPTHPDLLTQTEPIATDRLIVSGGFQPDLTLWHMAGGASSWDRPSARLLGEGDVEGVMLAGSVAGYRTNRACIRSGQAAVARLFGRTPPRVEDAGIDPIYETPPAPCSVSAWQADAKLPTYLDGGVSLTLRTPPVAPPRFAVWPLKRARRWPLADQARALSIGDVAAGVQIGAIPESDAGFVAQERSVIAGDLALSGRQQAPPEPVPRSFSSVPAWLTGRFGPEQTVSLVAAEDGRALEIGTLIYASSDRAEPPAAIGVVIVAASAGAPAQALVAAARVHAGSRVWARDISQLAPARLTPIPPDPKPPSLPVPAAVESPA